MLFKVNAYGYRRWMGLASIILSGLQVWSEEVPTNSPAVAQPRLPCILLIVVNGLGFGDLGCYGQESIKTPRIDELASTGVRFTNYYAAGADDTAAMAALLTSQSSAGELSSINQNLALRLKTLGYHTGFIGYWGMGNIDSPNAPQRSGFDDVVAYQDWSHAQDLYTGYLFRKDHQSGFEGRVSLAGNTAGKKEDYLPDLLTQAAARFCRYQRPQQLNNFRPFFLIVSYPTPAAVAGANGSSEEAQRGNAIARLDYNIGLIVDELTKRGIAQNTLIIISSNLGPGRGMGSVPTSSARPLSVGNQPLAEARLRVPLIVQWPFWVRTGSVSDLLLSGQDVYATILEAPRSEEVKETEGISFLPTIFGQDQTNRHQYLVWEHTRDDGTTSSAVRYENWKGIRLASDQPWQLFNLSSDPKEETNVADEHPELVEKLSAILEKAGHPAIEVDTPPAGS